MKFNFEEKENIVLLHINGELIGQHQLNAIIEPLKRYIEDEKCNFVVELSQLTNINSTGLTTLLMMLTKTRNAGGDTILANIPNQLSKLLVITKLNSIFMVKNSIAEAVEEFVKVLKEEN